MITAELVHYTEGSFEGNDGKDIPFIEVTCKTERGEFVVKAYKRAVMEFIKELDAGDKFKMSYEKSGKAGYKITDVAYFVDSPAPQSPPKTQQTPNTHQGGGSSPPIVSNALGSIIPAMIEHGICKNEDDVLEAMASVGNTAWELSSGPAKFPPLDVPAPKERGPRSVEPPPHDDRDIPLDEQEDVPF